MRDIISLTAAIAVISLTLVTTRSQAASGEPLHSQLTLSDVVQRSTLVAVCRLQKYAPLEGENVPIKPSGVDANGHPYYTSPGIVVAIESIKNPGAYTFDTVYNIKGASKQIQVNLPYIQSRNYGDARFPVEAGKLFLLFLKNGDDNRLIPTNPGAPFVPLEKSPKIPVAGDSSVQQALSLILSSLGDPVLRQANTYLLDGVVDAKIVTGLFPYLDDANSLVADNVLACLVENQQVAAIPRVAKLAARPDTHGKSLNAVAAIGDLHTIAAVPALNALIVHPRFDLRKASAYALLKLADRTSIPYLVLALRDPAPGQVIPAAAYVALRRLIPSLGPYEAQSQTEFIAHFPTETELINTWWGDELSGKHIEQNSQNLNDTVSAPKSEDSLGLQIMSNSPSQRMKAVRSLLGKTDRVGVPLLILALQDPDAHVAYEAYSALLGVTGMSGNLHDAEYYSTHREALNAPLYQWWGNELLRAK